MNTELQHNMFTVMAAIMSQQKQGRAGTKSPRLVDKYISALRTNI